MLLRLASNRMASASTMRRCFATALVRTVSLRRWACKVALCSRAGSADGPLLGGANPRLPVTGRAARDALGLRRLFFGRVSTP